MSQPKETRSNRREFLKTGGRIAAVGALTGVTIPFVHAAENNTIQLALVGCGGRGSGAADQALNTNNTLSSQAPPVKLVTMADVFPNKLKGSFEGLKGKQAANMDVPEDRKFLGFEAFKQSMDVLKKGDIVILATPPAFRWVQFKYAIEKGLHVFMEKPVTVDAPTTKRIIELGEKAKEKNLKVGVGLMVRHCRGRQALKKQVEEGAIGDIIAMRAYRMHGPVATAFSKPKPDNLSHTMYQIQRFHSFLWASGGLFSDFYIHQIDECCWMKGSWPVKAQAVGGRHYRGDHIDQNFDSYQVEYTFEDGTKFFFYGRTMVGCKDEFSSILHGSKGMGTVSLGGHGLGRAGRIFKGHNMKREEQTWAYPGPEPDPYQLEWNDLMEAIRDDKQYNEVKRGAEASLVTSMGRYAAHTGQEVTLEEFMNHDHEFAPGLEKLTPDGEPPLKPLADGKSYPIPQPGIVKKREYEG